EISEMYEAFVTEKPDHASVVAAMFWIGKARAREGKIEEAKQFTVDTLKRFIGEPRREAVEQLLTQLAQLCAKRPRPTAPVLTPVQVSQTKEPVIASTAAPVPAAEPPAPEPPPFDPAAELEKRLAPLEEGANATAKARLMYARAELASLRKKPADRDRLIESIAGEFKPEDLSPLLLAQIGDLHLGKGDHERAATYYTRLKEDFPKSDYLDVAYVGLGEIAFAKKKYDDALPLFTDALEKIAASMKLKEATIGKAKTLLELGQYAESRKLFEQVASVREWRGDSTAYAVFSLGEIEARQGRSAEAIAHYRRVFVAYQKFLPWVAKAYLRAAESFEKMGKRKDAIENLQEMLRNERLAPFPEAEQARRLLAQWGAT
ncbi:MAG TPA: tetratricopeptide repeat protein, partial [Chthoniobacteraceae bacterium]